MHIFAAELPQLSTLNPSEEEAMAVSNGTILLYINGPKCGMKASKMLSKGLMFTGAIELCDVIRQRQLFQLVQLWQLWTALTVRAAGMFSYAAVCLRARL